MMCKYVCADGSQMNFAKFFSWISIGATIPYLCYLIEESMSLKKSNGVIFIWVNIGFFMRSVIGDLITLLACREEHYFYWQVSETCLFPSVSLALGITCLILVNSDKLKDKKEERIVEGIAFFRILPLAIFLKSCLISFITLTFCDENEVYPEETDFEMEIRM